jgi:hypothetical protein
MFGSKARRIKQLRRQLSEISEIAANTTQHVFRAERERDSWIETARHYASGVQYYSGLLDLIAEHFGEEAYRCDDGSFSDDPLRAKMPDLVSDLCRQLHYYKSRLLRLPVIEAEFIFIRSSKP